MGCTIQDYGFTKSGVMLSGSSCSASGSDLIGCKARLYSDSAYGSIHVWFRYKKPDGTYASVNSNSVNVSSSGTYIFDAVIGYLSSVGNYFIDLVQVVPLYCEASGTPNSCRSLNVGSFQPCQPTSGQTYCADNKTICKWLGEPACTYGCNACPSTNICQNGSCVSCTTPKYKCTGTQCISDNCDGSGIYTTSNCNNVCNPSCTTPKYKCIGTQCISDNCDGSGIYTTSNCNNLCTGGGDGAQGCVPSCDPTKEFCLSFIGFGCQPKTYVYGAAGFLLLMMLIKR
ncbi:MAG: hypothetical protein PHP08_00360 [Candidatus Dojkabacteria bacterium]|nr:hypothetical protein [Candidatus Dojkabacteria bacterium]